MVYIKELKKLKRGKLRAVYGLKLIPNNRQVPLYLCALCAHSPRVCPPLFFCAHYFSVPATHTTIHNRVIDCIYINCRST